MVYVVVQYLRDDILGDRLKTVAADAGLVVIIFHSIENKWLHSTLWVLKTMCLKHFSNRREFNKQYILCYEMKNIQSNYLFFPDAMK